MRFKTTTKWFPIPVFTYFLLKQEVGAGKQVCPLHSSRSNFPKKSLIKSYKLLTKPAGCEVNHKTTNFALKYLKKAGGKKTGCYTAWMRERTTLIIVNDIIEIKTLQWQYFRETSWKWMSTKVLLGMIFFLWFSNWWTFFAESWVM